MELLSDGPPVRPDLVPAQSEGPLQRIGRSAWQLAGILVCAVAAGYLVRTMAVVVVPVLIALFPVAALQGLTEALKRRRVPRVVAALIVEVGALLLVLGILGAVVPLVAGQVQDLSDRLNEGLQTVQGFLDQRPFGIQVNVEDLVQRAQDYFRQGDLTQRLLGLTASIVGGLTTLVLVLVFVFFLLADGYRIADWAQGLFVQRARPDVAEIARRAWTSTRGYTRGVLAVALFDAVLIGLGSAIFVGPGLGLAIAVVTFVAAFIPVVGAFAIGVVATLVTFAVAGVTPALVVLAIVTVVQQVEGNFLSPYVMGRAVRLHPMAVLVVLSAAGTLLGILGALVAVPVAAAVHEAATYLRARYGW